MYFSLCDEFIRPSLTLNPFEAYDVLLQLISLENGRDICPETSTYDNIINDLHGYFEQAVSVITCLYYAACTHGTSELRAVANQRGARSF